MEFGTRDTTEERKELDRILDSLDRDLHSLSILAERLVDQKAKRRAKYAVTLVTNTIDLLRANAQVQESQMQIVF